MITYTDSTEGITPAQLVGFFAACVPLTGVGWSNSPSPETHLKLLLNSNHVVLALDDETGNIVGFITALSDGILAAYIPLLEVLPDYQGQGIGSELVRRMLEKLHALYAIDLICDPELQPFYRRFGMQPYSGMILRNPGRQSGSA